MLLTRRAGRCRWSFLGRAFADSGHSRCRLCGALKERAWQEINWIGTDTVNSIVERTQAFCRRFELRVPILLAPMAGACPASLSIAVANAGGLGACGGLLLAAHAVKILARDLRAGR